ncbi:MAG: TonB-dependent receptor plug domain-containing protein [Muribaculaceae bacterium]|nr:TonB-dependent receptor plug domain-containing protein [Muribaculaceae bacterium]
MRNKDIMKNILLLLAMMCLVGCGGAKWAAEGSDDKLPVTNFAQTIEGKETGVLINSTGMPGESPAILIRGISSLNASTDPLIILDGMTYNGPLNMINPSDIESVKVLKNPSETSIYGIRGGNGVVVITTKKGGSKKR